MKRVVLALVLLLLTGCATIDAPPHTYFPDDGDSPEMVVGFRAVNGLVTDRIIVTVNDQTIASGKLTLWRRQGDFQGEYQGKIVLAQCVALDRNSVSDTVHLCGIYIDGEKVTTLAF